MDSTLHIHNETGNIDCANCVNFVNTMSFEAGTEKVYKTAQKTIIIAQKNAYFYNNLQNATKTV